LFSLRRSESLVLDPRLHVAEVTHT